MKLAERLTLIVACVSAAILILAHNAYAQAGWTIGLDLLWFIRR